MSDDSGITLAVDRVYANCPKYIQRREPAAGGTGVTTHAAVRSEGLTPSMRDWISKADTFMIATAHPESGADASHRGGSPGFVRVSGDVLEWPDYSGNAMFNTGSGDVVVRVPLGIVGQFELRSEIGDL